MFSVLTTVGIAAGVAVFLAAAVAAVIAIRTCRASTIGADPERSALAEAPARLAHRDLPELETRKLRVNEQLQ